MSDWANLRLSAGLLAIFEALKVTSAEINTALDELAAANPEASAFVRAFQAWLTARLRSVLTSPVAIAGIVAGATLELTGGHPGMHPHAGAVA